MTHIDYNRGFWCENDEQDNGLCDDYAVRFCCSQFTAGDSDCHQNGYQWSEWFDADDPGDDGDFEYLTKFSRKGACQNPTGIEVEPRTSGATDVTHISLEYGFWCVNSENSAQCADFRVRVCCPRTVEFECTEPGHEWTIWIDSDDPDGAGDFEIRTSHPAYFACDSPTAIEAGIVGDAGSDQIVHYDSSLGVWCLNDEQPKGRTCADHKVRYCCPEEYHNPCKSTGLTCGSNSQILLQQNSTHSVCTCDCDEGYTQSSTDECIEDRRCQSTKTSCSGRIKE